MSGVTGPRIAAAVLVALAAGGCTSGLALSGDAQHAATPPSPAPLSTTALGTSPSSGTPCSYRQEDGYVLPDAGCTPGATNPAVTQSDIFQTICTRGWTATVRPPESYTGQLKNEQMGRYGDTGSMRGYEEDHLVPLELGGAPSDPKNLWPQPGASPNPKDDVEYAANRAVCSGRLTLADAQRGIAGDWVTLGRILGVLEGTN